MAPYDGVPAGDDGAVSCGRAAGSASFGYPWAHGRPRPVLSCTSPPAGHDRAAARHYPVAPSRPHGGVGDRSLCVVTHRLARARRLDGVRSVRPRIDCQPNRRRPDRPLGRRAGHRRRHGGKRRLPAGPRVGRSHRLGIGARTADTRRAVLSDQPVERRRYPHAGPTLGAHRGARSRERARHVNPRADGYCRPGAGRRAGRVRWRGTDVHSDLDTLRHDRNLRRSYPHAAPARSTCCPPCYARR